MHLAWMYCNMVRRVKVGEEIDDKKNTVCDGHMEDIKYLLPHVIVHPVSVGCVVAKLEDVVMKCRNTISGLMKDSSGGHSLKKSVAPLKTAVVGIT